MVFIGPQFKVNKNWQIDSSNKIKTLLEVHRQQVLVIRLEQDSQLDSNNLQWEVNKIVQVIYQQAWFKVKTSNSNKMFK